MKNFIATLILTISLVACSTPAPAPIVKDYSGTYRGRFVTDGNPGEERVLTITRSGNAFEGTIARPDNSTILNLDCAREVDENDNDIGLACFYTSSSEILTMSGDLVGRVYSGTYDLFLGGSSTEGTFSFARQ